MEGSKMNILGIIVEYNPFHRGHSSHLERSKAATGCETVIAVMSGNFVQRGEPAICDKWTRTRMALEAGVDLVIELPLYYATGGAEYFARGAVTLLAATGLVNYLCFGSECADINAITDRAQILQYECEDRKLKEYLRQGLSYPAAREKAYEKFTTFDAKDGLLSKPNNILGVEYVKAILGLKTQLTTDIKACTVPRSPGAAKNIRENLRNGISAEQDMPNISWKILNESVENYGAAELDNLSATFQSIVRNKNFSQYLHNYVGISEGLENRFVKYAQEYYWLSDILAAVKTKRYTYTRLQRAVLHIILDITKECLAEYENSGGPQYIRVLGFKRDRTDLLKTLERNASLPIVMNLKNAILPELATQMLSEEVRSTDLYSLAFPPPKKGRPARSLHEYAMPLVIL